MGTLALGRVVDERGRWRGVDGLWVADGSLFPTSLGGPPQLSIYAAGHKVAGHLVECAAMRRARVAGAAARSLLDAAAPTCATCSRPTRQHPEEVEALLAEQTPLPHYDAALVLGCPADPDGTPSPCERCRVKTRGAPVSRAAPSASIVFSGGAAHSPDVEADVMGDLAERRGVPAGDVLREGRALTTWQNVRFSLAILRAHALGDGAGDLDRRSPAARAPHRPLLGPRRRAHRLLRLRSRSAARLARRSGKPLSRRRRRTGS